ncbi:hypothetical protein CDV55_106921 [Aspergillus turcosus]|uniref:Uncharacterized protein n=1 Tax=Aspergillus turcosus TaxID=1245748 RepID=A0A397HE65_9EURO|nr:hypothetical protein CDV55_106921 [Aspergillus turcosus]RLL98440.1 hypothetical protein CFD26_103881 [Aspergillus turcosus]
MSIPVLHASALSGVTPEQLAESAARLMDSLDTYGFEKLVNHMIPLLWRASTSATRGQEITQQVAFEADLPGYQDTMERFFLRGALTVALLEVMAQTLNLDPKLFTSQCTNEASTIHINRFPPIQRTELDEGQDQHI